MAWTGPRTWTTGEVVTAAMMNTHVRDNLLETAVAKVTTAGDMVYATAANALARLGLGAYAGGLINWKHVVKSADESVTSSTTLQNDDHLLLAIAANEIWLIEGVIIAQSASATPHFKFGFTAPTSPTYASMDFIAPDTTGGFQSGSLPVATGAGVEVQVNQPTIIQIRWYIANAANAGNFQFQWAQNTSNGTAMKVLKGSYIRGMKVA